MPKTTSTSKPVYYRESKNGEKRRHQIAIPVYEKHSAKSVFFESQLYEDKDNNLKSCQFFMRHAPKDLSDNICQLPTLAEEIAMMNKFYKANRVYIDATATIPSEDLCFIERIPGINGVDWIYKLSGKMPDDFLQIALAGLYGLLQIHNQKILHRDIKLENSIIFPFYNLLTKKIELGLQWIDFDLARPLDKLPQLDGCGSKGYAPPEVLTKKPTRNEKSDLYSFGKCLARYRRQYAIVNPSILSILHGMLLKNPKDRIDVNTAIEGFKKIYNQMMGRSYQHFHKPRIEQSKLDKLLKLVTTMIGLNSRSKFKDCRLDFMLGNEFEKDTPSVNNFRILFEMLRNYSTPEKIIIVIPEDNNEILAQAKRKIFLVIAHYVTSTLTTAAVYDLDRAASTKRLITIADTLHAINTIDNLDSFIKTVTDISINDKPFFGTSQLIKNLTDTLVEITPDNSSRFVI